MDNIKKCKRCRLFKNQLPLLDKKAYCDIMWVGLSAKKVEDVNNSTPLKNDTNSGKIIEMIEKELDELTFYKTNLVKCLPLNEKNKLRYPLEEEMQLCIKNLKIEIEQLKPKIVLILGKKAYNFVIKNFVANNIEIKNIVYIEHPSYIYVYKKKYINEYIEKVKKIINNNI